MQLHACLLLFIITTGKVLALLEPQCGGSVHLDQESTGHISLTLPTGTANTARPSPINNQTETSLQEEQVLETGGTALLSSCDENKAALTWRGAGHSSNKIQLSYHVQEAERNSSEHPSSLGPHQGRSTAIPWSQTGTSFTSKAPIAPQQGQEAVQGTEEGIGHPYVWQGWSSGPQTRSAPSLQDQGERSSPTPLPSLTMAGTADRETPPLPQEEADNGADVSGVAHITEGHMAAKESTHPYFQTQHTMTMDTLSNPSQTLSKETYSHMPHTLQRDTLAQTQKTLTDAADSHSNTVLGTNMDKNPVIHTSKYTDGHTATHTLQIDSTGSSTSALPLTPSPKMSYLRFWATGTTIIPHESPGEKQAPAWRSQRSTDRLHSSLVTSDPLKSPSNPQWNSSTSIVTAASPPSSHGRTNQSSPTHRTELDTFVGTAASSYPFTGRTVTFASAASDSTSHIAAFGSSDRFESSKMLHTPPPSLSPAATHSQTNSPQDQHTGSDTHFLPSYTSSPHTQTSSNETHTAPKNTHTATDFITTYTTSNPFIPNESPISSSENSSDIANWTSGYSGSPSTPTAQDSTAMETTYNNLTGNESLQGEGTDTKTYTPLPTHSVSRDVSHTHAPLLTSSPTHVPFLPFTATPGGASTPSSIPKYMSQTETTLPTGLHTTHTPLPLTPSTTESPTHTPLADHKAIPTSLQTPTLKSSSTPQTYSPVPLTLSPDMSPTFKQSRDYITTTHTTLPSHTKAANTESEHGGEKGNEHFIVSAAPSQQSYGGPTSTTHSPTARSPQQPPSWTEPYPSRESHLGHTTPVSVPPPTWRSRTTLKPKFYIVADQPATIRVESIELLLQIIVEESNSAVTAGLEEDTTAWLEPYLLRAPGFSRLQGVWSSGVAVQSVVEFRTRGALDWLGVAGPASLLERTGLAQAVREGRRFRSSRITNITVGGLQGGVCDWLLQCPAGYECVSQPSSTNHSCSSVCHSDYCHHHGICTHHPDQLPVCRCLVGDDFWYMGQRCDMKMTRARLVGACLAILLIMVTVIAILALVAVRRYRAMLIQAKVDQTRSSYRRFNHFDELSGRFWLRSLAGSADSLDNPAFTRSDELLHLRALDRPCCYHDDTLSLASTCPSHGTRINTVYPHSSQYGWRGSEMSMGDCVLDSGKASDLSVCSWPVEPIQWTPFPLLQQLASHRTPTVRASRPRSYCEGMELVDLGKSWTA
ncbi:mucin-5AC isoform X2 [Myripristis murdjan]|uniref:Mucin-5AC-like n=1 Tax=Myripristis murdjan TaxID=586833 RepID=A0A667WBJ1_9TELE|nr:mucin-5AC-like isoform X2 [Myripristis murdjan]